MLASALTGCVIEWVVPRRSSTRAPRTPASARAAMSLDAVTRAGDPTAELLRELVDGRELSLRRADDMDPFVFGAVRDVSFTSRCESDSDVGSVSWDVGAPRRNVTHDSMASLSGVVTTRSAVMIPRWVISSSDGSTNG